MEIFDPVEVSLTNEMMFLLGEADAELAAYRDLGDFSEKVREEMAMAFLPERLSDTLNIEGVRVNPRVTRAVLEGLTLADSDKYTEREILNVIEANDFIEQFAASEEPISLLAIREIHRRVGAEIIQDAGALRQHNIRITGASFRPPDWADIAELLGVMCERYESSGGRAHPILRACFLHATFTKVHPFVDGNGRTGRMLQDLALLKSDFLPVGIPADRRQEYYDALEEADNGRWVQLAAIVANSELTALDKARRIAQAPIQRRQRIRDLLKASETVVRQTEYRQFELWRRHVDAFRSEFQRWVDDLNSASETIQIGLKVWDPISFEKWNEIREEGHARGTWIFTMNFRVSKRPVYSFLFYARRHFFPYVVDVEEVDYGLVSIFVTGDEEPSPNYDFRRFSDPYVRFREVLWIRGEACVYRDPEAMQHEILGPEAEAALQNDNRWRPAVAASIPDVVEEFLEDALRKLGLVT